MKIRCSNLHQAKLCPGSVQAQEGLPDQSSRYSEEGELIHKLLTLSNGGEIEALPKLNKDQRKTYDLCVKIRDWFISDYSKGTKIADIVQEQIFEYGALTGHPDWIGFYVTSDGKLRSLLDDVKTGYIEVDEPADNMQLRGYAYLLFHTYSMLDEVIAHITQPHAKRTDPCQYTRTELPDIDFEIEQITAEASKPGARRIPSPEACRYCKACGTPRCPETMGKLSEIAKINPDLLTSLPASKKLELWKSWKVVESIGKKIKEVFTSELKFNPASIPGLALEPGAEVRTIADVQGAYESLQDVVAQSDFLACCSISVGKLEELYGEKTGLVGKALTEKFNQVLKHYIEMKPNNPSLKAVKAKESLHA